ncbi:MAG: putative rane protein [Acidimicrobiales bacterium]|nr:putative rane protein [Acidimicrobiales bacterium]
MARKDDSQEGGLGRILTPVASLVILAGAFANTALERRAGNDVSANGPDGPDGPDGPAGAGAKATKRSKPEFTGIKAKLARYRVLRLILEVQQRYGEVHGNNVASAVAFQMFISLFPLMLVIVGVLGFVAAGSNTDVAGKIISNLGLTGEGATAIHNAVATAEKSRRAASVVGLGGLLWSGLGLVNALQYGYNQVWQVEERGLKDKAVGLGWLVGAAVIFVAAAAVTSIIGLLPAFFAPLGFLVSIGVNFALWLWTANVLPNRNVGWRPLVPGALFGAVGLEVLKIAGGYYVPRLVTHSSQLYGSLGVVFAVLAWILIFSRLILYSACLNVVLYEKKRGTIKTTIEVPAVPAAKPDETSRAGRVEREDLATA